MENMCNLLQYTSVLLPKPHWVDFLILNLDIIGQRLYIFYRPLGLYLIVNLNNFDYYNTSRVDSVGNKILISESTDKAVFFLI